ncbi:hypothetical protein ALC62_09718 [Cyphomyrmex costatus]|uniref:Uncharacterized protein n=1 Tax=Cyphomyrmex costatus TaxID=456900 RepID=A0A151IF59_9HYME|nr:hypothetical protein ALC62_09718 [Cyphomyrmex costatus]
MPPSSARSYLVPTTYTPADSDYPAISSVCEVWIHAAVFDVYIKICLRFAGRRFVDPDCLTFAHKYSSVSRWYRAVYGRKGRGTLACNEGVAADHTRPKNTLSTKPTPFCTLLPSPPPGGNESFIARYLFRPPLAVKSRGDRKRRHGNFVSVFSTTMKTSRQIDECHIFRERT